MNEDRVETSASGFLFLPATHLYPEAIIHSAGNLPVLLVEDSGLCSRRRYHQQKLALILAAMRNLASDLRAAGRTVIYYDLDAGQNIASAISATAKSLGTESFSTFDVIDRNLSRYLTQTSESSGLTWIRLGDPGFLSQAPDVTEMFSRDRPPRMETFYRQQRRAMHILVDTDGNPIGGRWNFDQDNRQKIPSQQALPIEPRAVHNQITQDTMREVAKRFSSHPGNALDLWLPADQTTATAWLRDFIDQRLVGFGTYEDAISSRSEVLFHSALSPLLNIGLVTPDQVVAAALSRADVPLNDLEGFIRQVIGWREFIRGIYVMRTHSRQLENKRSHGRAFTPHWYDGTTGIEPLDHAIRTMLRRGWNHHIERLMILANLMNLCEIAPQRVYEYFMTHHIDAYDWVMRPNIEGMGMSSSDDAFATKPYICGSNYILKMSDHQKGEWCHVVDGLYWRFVKNHRAELAANARTALTVKSLDRLTAERRTLIFSHAENFLDRCTTSLS